MDTQCVHAGGHFEWSLCGPGAVGTLSGRFVDRVQKEQAAPTGASKLGFSSMHYSVLEASGVARVRSSMHHSVLEALGAARKVAANPGAQRWR
eukprot:1160526-Pelagomonas_calceolata.AAC.6